jgi:murein DD-endopeptidase MepM/ murein hydrolase activator NlpD
MRAAGGWHTCPLAQRVMFWSCTHTICLIFELETNYALKMWMHNQFPGKTARPRTRMVRLLIISLLLVFTLPSPEVWAQSGAASGPVYVVEYGDTLWDIALRFGVSLDDLRAANGIGESGSIAVGMQLVIPGLEGVEGVLTTQRIGVGENLSSLSHSYGVPPSILARINRLSSPAELYAGMSLILPVSEQEPQPTQRTVLAPGQSLLELAAARGVSPWSVTAANGLGSAWDAVPGEVLRFSVPAGAEGAEGPGALPDAVRSMSVSPLPLVQGGTAVVALEGEAGLALQGSLADYPLTFFPTSQGGYAALQGVHAMQTPGQYLLRIEGTLSSGAAFSFAQTLFVRSGNYAFDPVLVVSPETVDPAVMEPEEAEWKAIAAAATPDKLWEGIWQSPTPPPFDQCWPSLFGNRRSYNGSEYKYFHSGLDFCGGVGTAIHAPAAGVVVFAGPLTVRGNATIINHGWGVYTGYMHQSEILVATGERVSSGQLIGKVGATGRVTGPHLHWEVFVGGVQVEPQDWLRQAYP